MEFVYEIIKTLLDASLWLWYFALAWYGLVIIGGSLTWLWFESRYVYRKAQVHKGAIFVKEKNKDNPFKDTTRVFAEVLDRQEGYVIFKVEGDEISITMREFLRLFRVWYGEYIDEEDN